MLTTLLKAQTSISPEGGAAVGAAAGAAEVLAIVAAGAHDRLKSVLRCRDSAVATHLRRLQGAPRSGQRRPDGLDAVHHLERYQVGFDPWSSKP
jgi:hypothetical protein